jgi:hypothetical protein
MMHARLTTAPVKPPPVVALDTCVLSAKTRCRRLRRPLQARRDDGPRATPVAPQRLPSALTSQTDSRHHLENAPRSP